MLQSDTFPLPDAFVALFWGIREGEELKLVVDPVHLTQARVNGEDLTPPQSHYDVREDWHCVGPLSLVGNSVPSLLTGSEYVHWPWGRTVFHVPTRRFRIYADRRLVRDPDLISLLADALHMPAGSYHPGARPYDWS
jgi:hypothetical protein